MIAHPRTSSYVRTDDWDEEAERKWRAAAGREAGRAEAAE